MKKKQLIISLSLAVTVLFSILVQSVHAYNHFAKQFSQTECHHKYNVTNTEITHQHHTLEQCYVCSFAFGSYVAPEQFSYNIESRPSAIPYFYEDVETIFPFSGSLYSHRGPPVSIV